MRRDLGVMAEMEETREVENVREKNGEQKGSKRSREIRK